MMQFSRVINCNKCDAEWLDGSDAHPHDHVVDHLLNVGWLVADRNLGEARQVDQRQIQHVRRVNAKIDGNRTDACAR